MRALFFWLSFFTLVAAQDVVVTSVKSTLSTLDRTEVKRLFLAQTNRLPNGEKVQLLELDDTALKSRFYRRIAQKSLAQAHAYWTTLIFTGKGKPPKTLSTLKALEAVMIDQPNAIAYLPKTAVTPKMKVLYTLP